MYLQQRHLNGFKLKFMSYLDMLIQQTI